MSLMPPDIAQPIQTEADRVAMRNLLGQRDRKLRSIEKLAHTRAAQWTPDEIVLFPNTIAEEPNPPYSRLERWAAVFAEELEEVHRLAVRPLSDIELRQTLYLTGRLIATVSGRAIGDVDNFDIEIN